MVTLPQSRMSSLPSTSILQSIKAHWHLLGNVQRNQKGLRFISIRLTSESKESSQHFDFSAACALNRCLVDERDQSQWILWTTGLLALCMPSQIISRSLGAP